MTQAQIVNSYTEGGYLVVHAAVDGDGSMVVDGPVGPSSTPVRREYRVVVPLAEVDGLSQAKLGELVRAELERARADAGVTAPAAPNLPKTLSLD